MEVENKAGDGSVLINVGGVLRAEVDEIEKVWV